jgi:FkbM family methyltransferase
VHGNGGMNKYDSAGRAATEACSNPSQTISECILQLTGGAKRSFYYRASNSSDRSVIQQIFRNRDYDLSPFRQTHWLRRFASVPRHLNKKLLVIDAGANIGASAVFFAQMDRRIHVCAIEPERSNFELLSRNCMGLSISEIQSALSCQAEQLWLSDPGLSHWGYRVGTEAGTATVDALGVFDVLARFPADDYLPAICKIDIEGGEERLFSRNDTWIDLFPLIIIELHDWMLPGKASSGNFLRSIGRRDFDVINYRENLFCFNNALISKRTTDGANLKTAIG